MGSGVLRGPYRHLGLVRMDHRGVDIVHDNRLHHGFRSGNQERRMVVSEGKKGYLAQGRVHRRRGDGRYPSQSDQRDPSFSLHCVPLPPGGVLIHPHRGGQLVENVGAMGASVPEWLKKAIAALQDKVDETAGKTE